MLAPMQLELAPLVRLLALEADDAVHRGRADEIEVVAMLTNIGMTAGAQAARRMLEQGVASAEDIDKAMELGYNHPMGPLKLTDQVGLDVRLAIAEYLHATLGKPHYEPPRILREKVKKGELGRKTGKGFYTWSD